MNLSLTLDYELWGNGTGSVFEDIVYPTEKFLKICDQYNIKTTIFFEVVEYWKIKEQWENGEKMGYSQNPSVAMEKQIIEASKKGHDIQLHIHPQWINSHYSDGKWVLDNRFWRLSAVPLLPSSMLNMGLDELLKKGKETLESIIRPHVANYKCNILRAGGFNIDPSKDIISVLSKYGFELDSSVFAGGYENGKLSKYDFRDITSSTPYWYASKNDIKQQGKSNLIELSMFSYPVRRIFKYSFSRLLNAYKNKAKVMETVQNKTDKKSKLEKIKYLFEKEHVTFDFCLFSFSQYKRFFRRSAKIVKISEYKYHPIVLIGHSKAFNNEQSFTKMLKYSLRKGTKFQTLTQINEQIRK